MYCDYLKESESTHEGEEAEGESVDQDDVASIDNKEG